MSHAKTAQVAEDIVRSEIRKAAAVHLAILKDTIAPMVSAIDQLHREVELLKAQINQQGAGVGPPNQAAAAPPETSPKSG